MSAFKDFLDSNKDPEKVDPATTSPEIGNSSFGSFLKKNQNVAPLKNSFNQSKFIDSDKATDSLQIQGRKSLPLDTINRKQPEIKGMLADSSFDATKFSLASPKTAEWMSESPNHAAIAKQDIASMSYLERQMEFISGKYDAGETNVELGDLGFRELIGSSDDRQKARIKELQFRSSEARDYGIDGFIEGIPGAVAEQIPIYQEMVSGGIKGLGIGAVIGGGIGLFAGPAGLAAGASRSGRFGFRAGMIKEAAEMESGLAYLELRNIKDEATGEPIDPAVAKGAAVTVGVVNSALEMFGLERIANSVPGLRQFKKEGIKSLLRNPGVKRTLVSGFKNLGVAMAAEGATEGLQELSNIVANEFSQAYANGEISSLSFGAIFDRIFSEENQARILEAARAGAQAGGGFSAVGQVADVAISQANVRTQSQQIRTAAATKDAVEKIGRAVQSSKLFNKSPEVAQKFVDKIIEDSPSKSVYVDVETFSEYYQGKDEDPRTIADRLLGDSGRSYAEAIQNGTPLEIPLSRYTTAIATNPEDNQFFSNEVRAEIDGPNVREQSELFQETLKQDDAVSAEIERQVEIEDAAREVKASVQTQLEETGLPASSAKVQAELYESTFRTLGQRTNQDPRELFERYGLRIQRPDLLENIEVQDEIVFNQEEKADVSAEFLGFQERPGQDPLPLYNIVGGNNDGSTVTASTLEKNEIQVPETPAFTELEQSDGKNPRGRIRIGANQNISIDLFKKADLSTFLHETGHFYLEVLADLAADPDAPQQIKNDFQGALEFLEVDSREGIETAQHEKWARAFEAYLREGKAPTPQLRGAFARFKAWLTSIYKRLSDLNVELNDDVRGVFDRLVATDEEIAQVREQSSIRPLFENPQEFGFDAVEAEQYSKSISEARLSAEEAVAQKAISDFDKERAKIQKDRRREIEDEIENRLNQQPLYMALSVLQRGQMPDGSPVPEAFQDLKISKESLLQNYDQNFLNKLPKPFIYSRSGGLHVDQVAELFGYSTGDQMITEIVNNPSKQEAIKIEADKQMAERFKEGADGGALKREVVESIYSDRSSEIMQAELEHMTTENFATFKNLNRRIARRVPKVEEIRSQAEESIAIKKVRDIRPIVYQRAESKAAKEAQEALLRGDWNGAFDAQKRRILNHELFRAATNAREQVDKTVNYMARFNRNTVRSKLGLAGADYLEQIDSIMDRFSFKRSLSLKQIDRNKSLLAFVKEQEANGEPVNIPDEIVNEAMRKPYQELTLEELIAVDDTVRNIAHLSKTKNELVYEDRVRKFREVQSEILSSIQANHEIKDRPVSKAKDFTERVGEFFEKANASHSKMEFLFEWLDGNEANGAVWRSLFKPISDAENNEVQMRDVASKELDDIFSAYTINERALWNFKPIEIEGVDSPVLKNKWTKQMIFSVALNWGNLENRKALMDGYGWSEDQVAKILDNLDQRDWQTIQKLWDFIDSFWPDIAKQEREMAGLVPQKVEAAPVETKYGTFKGGYYPLVYDGEISTSQSQLDEKRAINEAFGGEFSRASTRKGHTKERVGSGGKPPSLSMSVLTEHTTNVIHDLTHRRAIVDVLKIVENKEIKAVIESVAGRDLYRKIRPWLHDIAKDRRGEPGKWFDSKMFSGIRQGATVVNMGWKFTTAIVQFTGYTVSVKELGFEYGLKGLKNTFGNVGQFQNKWKSMTEMSHFMSNRISNFDRDVRDTLRRLNVAGTKTGVSSVVDSYTAGLDSAYFSLIGYMDMAVAMPTWWGAYEKAMDGNVANIKRGDSAAAVQFADRTVRVTQGSGGIKDLAEIQRGSEAFKTFTMFYSYFSILYQQFQKTNRQYKLDGDVSKVVASLALIWVAPSLIEAFTLGRHPDLEEADETEWAQWALLNIGGYPTQTVIGLRDVVNGMDEYGYSPSAAFGGYEALARAGREGLETITDPDEEFTRSDAKNIFLTVGYFAKLPSRQIWLSGEYFYDWLSGSEEPDNFIEGLWRGLVIGKEKK